MRQVNPDNCPDALKELHSLLHLTLRRPKILKKKVKLADSVARQAASLIEPVEIEL